HIKRERQKRRHVDHSDQFTSAVLTCAQQAGTGHKIKRAPEGARFMPGRPQPCSLPAISASRLPWNFAPSNSCSEGMREPSPSVVVVMPYGEPPRTTSLPI